MKVIGTRYIWPATYKMAAEISRSALVSCLLFWLALVDSISANLFGHCPNKEMVTASSYSGEKPHLSLLQLMPVLLLTERSREVAVEWKSF